MRSLWLALTALLAVAPAHAQTAPASPVVLPGETILRTKGEGRVSVAPARMQIFIGVATTGASAAEALELNSAKLAPVIEVLRAQGIAPADIQTDGLSVEPEYSDARGRDSERIIGFRANNRIKVVSRDIGAAGDLISLLFEAGANRIDGPEFLVAEEDEERLARLAEADALREARAQADAAAAALGMRVNRVLLVSDSTVQFRSGSGVIVVTGSRLSRVPVEPGEISIEAEYDVEFALVAE